MRDERKVFGVDEKQKADCGIAISKIMWLQQLYDANLPDKILMNEFIVKVSW